MWGGKKAREKYNLDDVEIDEYGEQESCSSSSSSGRDYSENDVWHMLYGIRESYMDANVSVNGVNVRKWTDGSFDITLSVNVEYHSYNTYGQDYIEKCVNNAMNNVLRKAKNILSNKGISASISIHS